MVIQNFIRKKIDSFLKKNYSINNVKYDVNVTKKEFEGDYTGRIAAASFDTVLDWL